MTIDKGVGFSDLYDALNTISVHWNVGLEITCEVHKLQDYDISEFDIEVIVDFNLW